MKLLLVIEADTNDADYVTEMTEVTPETLEPLLPIFAAIKAMTVKHQADRNHHNWPNSEYANDTVESVYEGILTEEQIEFFNDYAPQGEYGIHTIKLIKVLNVESETAYL
jgi:hypothetical protein